MTPATRRHPWTQSYFQGVLNELLKEPDADKCIAILVSVWDAGGNAANMSQPTLASEKKLPWDRERMARWHATFNAALTGSMACGTKYMDACADARGAANHMHGPLPEEKP